MKRMNQTKETLWAVMTLFLDKLFNPLTMQTLGSRVEDISNKELLCGGGGGESFVTDGEYYHLPAS